MATAVIMPKLGNSVESSQILAWHKAVGDVVERGQMLCEIETDKATMEVQAPESGVLLEIYYPENAEVAVMTTIAMIGQAGEVVPKVAPVTAPPLEVETVVPAAVPVQILQTFATPKPANRIFASPRARQLARQQNLPLDGLVGSGPNRRILERDVEQAPKLPEVVPVPVVQPVPPPVSQAQNPYPDAKATPLKGIRAKIAGRMLESLHSTAQLTLHTSADARALQAYHQRLKLMPDAPKVTLSHLVMFVVARTLRQHPALNALLENNVLYEFSHVHLGFAVASSRGLLVPIIRDAARLSLRELTLEAQRLVADVQNTSSAAADLQGGTFTVSNLGAYGIEQFTPILNPPQVAILGVGGINLKPVQQDQNVIFVPHLSLSLTVDHQVIDGAPAAQFLQSLAQNLAQLELLI